MNSSEKVSKEVMYELSYCYYDANQLNKAIEGFKQLSTERDSMGQNSMYLLGDCYLRTNQKPMHEMLFNTRLQQLHKVQQQVSSGLTMPNFSLRTRLPGYCAERNEEIPE